MICDKDIPYSLLLLADPSINKIKAYLDTGICFVAKWGSEVIGVIVLSKLNIASIEITNIAVDISLQGNGYGTRLLNFAETYGKENGCRKLKITTGNSSIGQLRLYQKVGFEIVHLDRDYFIQNYSEPIFENGLQCKDRIVLEKDL